MKKLLFTLFVLAFTFVLAGCSKKMDIDYNGIYQVSLKKNVEVEDGCFSDTKAYKTYNIIKEEQIEEFFTELNKIKYKEVDSIEACGYTFTIYWKGNNIQIIDDEHFIMNEKYYKLTKGSFDFLKDYQFEEEVEEEEEEIDQ